MTDDASGTAASNTGPETRSALGQFAKCLGWPLVMAALVFLGLTRGEAFGGLFAPVGQAIVTGLEVVLSAFALVAAYQPVGLLLLGMALIAGCACYFMKTDGKAKKVNGLARSVGWTGGGFVVLAFLGGLSYPHDTIRYFQVEPNSLSVRGQAFLLNGSGGDMNYMNCQRIAGAYLSAGAETQKRLAVEVNGTRVMAGQRPAEHCQMFFFNKVHYGYAHSALFAASSAIQPD